MWLTTNVLSHHRLNNRNGRGDGIYVIEPDKAADAGHGFVLLANATAGTAASATFRHAAVAVADTMSKMVRAPPMCNDTHSPWPFRVNAKTGEVIEQYVCCPCNNFSFALKSNVECVVGDTCGYVET